VFLHASNLATYYGTFSTCIEIGIANNAAFALISAYYQMYCWGSVSKTRQTKMS